MIMTAAKDSKTNQTLMIVEAILLSDELQNA